MNTVLYRPYEFGVTDGERLFEYPRFEPYADDNWPLLLLESQVLFNWDFAYGWGVKILKPIHPKAQTAMNTAKLPRWMLDFGFEDTPPQPFAAYLAKFGLVGQQWYEFVDEKAILFTVGKLCDIKPEMRLASGGELCEQLALFFCLAAPFVRDLSHQSRRFTQSQVAAVLDALGAQTADGFEINNSHVSNCLRKSVNKVGPACSKPNYQSCNWTMFSHQRAPKKTTFGSIRTI